MQTLNARNTERYAMATNESLDESRETLAAKLEASERMQSMLAREPMHWFYLTESQVQSLAGGIVTQALKLTFAYALDVMGELEQNAAKPTPKRKGARHGVERS